MKYEIEKEMKIKDFQKIYLIKKPLKNKIIASDYKIQLNK